MAEVFLGKAETLEVAENDVWNHSIHTLTAKKGSKRCRTCRLWNNVNLVLMISILACKLFSLKWPQASFETTHHKVTNCRPCYYYASKKLGLEVGPPFDYRDILIEKSISFWPNQLIVHVGVTDIGPTSRPNISG